MAFLFSLQQAPIAVHADRADFHGRRIGRRLYLTRKGRREGMDLIFKGIRNFIMHSGRTHTNKVRGLPQSVRMHARAARAALYSPAYRLKRAQFHETMTYFW